MTPLRRMHVYFVRGVYRWLFPTPEYDDGTDWEAEAHFKRAVLCLEELRG